MNKRIRLTLIFLILLFLTTGSYVYWQTRFSKDLSSRTSQIGNDHQNHIADEHYNKLNTGEPSSKHTHGSHFLDVERPPSSLVDQTLQTDRNRQTAQPSYHVFMAGSPIAVLSSTQILGQPPYEESEKKALQEAVKTVSDRLHLQVVIDRDSESEINFTRVIWSSESLDITGLVASEMQKITTK